MLLYIAMMDRIEMKFEMMSSTYRIEPLAIADTQPIADPTGFGTYFFYVFADKGIRRPPYPKKS